VSPDGSTRWALAVSAAAVRVRAAAFDDARRAYLVGQLAGAGVLGGLPLAGDGDDTDGYVLVVSPEGKAVVAVRVGEHDANESIAAVAIHDPSESLFLAVEYEGTVTLGEVSYTSIVRDAYVARLPLPP
jgi:hypothetical protein